MGTGEIILIHKKGDQSTPSNYRPIILSSTIRKLFHKILALRMEKFLCSKEDHQSLNLKRFPIRSKWNDGTHFHFNFHH